MAMAHFVYQLMQEMQKPPQAWLLLLFPLFLILLHYSWANFATTNRRSRQQPVHRLPPSPPALPIIGHLHLVGSLPHVSLCSLARKHGPDLMFLRLGTVPTLIVSSPRAAEAVLRTHDHVFASRPRNALDDTIMDGSSEQWRQAKKLITTHFLSVKKVQSFRLAREEEVSMAMAKISEAAAAGAAVDMSNLFISFTNDMVCRAVSGKFFRKEGQNKLFQELIHDTSQLLGGFNIEDYFPILARVSPRAKSVKTRWDELLNKVIDDHENEYNSACDHKDDDFTNVLLSVKQEYGLTRERMKAMLMDVFFGAADTTSQLLESTMAVLMRWPRLMEKLQTEVRSSIPEGQEIVSEVNINNMTYLRAVIKEALRLHPVGPLLVPHLSMANCNIDGYVIPAGTRVFVNAWAIGRDKCFWENAEEFMPERFLDGGSAMCVNFKGNDFQYLPFGAGRRMCPGVNLAMANVEMMLTNLIHHFDWELPSGMMEIDMSEVFGITVRRKEKLLLVPKLRV